MQEFILRMQIQRQRQQKKKGKSKSNLKEFVLLSANEKKRESECVAKKVSDKKWARRGGKSKTLSDTLFVNLLPD